MACRDEFGRVDPKRAGDAVDVHQADIPLATLDAAHVGAVKAALKRELLLRDSSSRSSVFQA